MKTLLFFLCCTIGITAEGQLAPQSVLNVSQPSAASTVIDVGPHSRTWSNGHGGNPIIELATGMNFWNGQKWVASNPSFQVSADGTAFVANQVQHKIRLAANLNAIGSVAVATPDGLVLDTTPVGIGLYDAASGNSLIIGAITNCSGVLVSSNRVIYQNVFAGVSADIVFTLNGGSFQQDVVITANINPADYGFPIKTTRIQILTECYFAPQPDEIVHPIYVEKNQTIRNSMVAPDLVDQTLGFGELILGKGKAYAVGTTATNASAPVAKEFTTILGRTFLVESVQYSSIQRGLNALPQGNVQTASAAARRNRNKSKAGYASIPMPHPAAKVKVAAVRASERMAKAEIGMRAGVVIDYVATIGGTLSGTTVFRGDTTYFVSGPVYCSGDVTIEAGAVFKYPNDTYAYIEIQSTLTLATANYRPAIFTAADDNSIGDQLSSIIWHPYNGIVQPGGYANPALLFDNPPATLSNLRFCYAQQAVHLSNMEGNSATFAHSQFINCVQGILIDAGSSGAFLSLNNCLVANVQSPILDSWGGGDSYYLNSCTIDGGGRDRKSVV